MLTPDPQEIGFSFRCFSLPGAKDFSELFGHFFSKCRLTKSLCTEPKPLSVFKNNQFKEKAQENELDEQQS